jgi:DNA polymerase-3 subunit delta
MIFFLYGPDTYRSRKKLKELKEKFIREVDKTGLNISELDGEKLTLGRFREATLTPGFLTRRRMVIIRNICQNRSPKVQEEAIKFLERKDEGRESIIVFWEDSRGSQRKNKLYNQLKQQRYAQEFNLLRGYKLNSWIKEEVSRKKGRIEAKAVNLLVDYIGSDLWRMNNEIDKLIAYRGGKIITFEDVELLVKSKIDENIFNLVDALGMKDKKLALRLLNDQLENKLPWTYLMAMIIRQFRILLQIKSFAPISDLHPYFLQKVTKQAEKYSLEELKNIYQNLLKIDTQLKTTQIEPKVLFNLFILKI